MSKKIIRRVSIVEMMRIRILVRMNKIILERVNKRLGRLKRN